MEQLMVISAVGGDRTGVVHDLTRVVLDCGGSIRESRMTTLGSEFAMLVLVSGNWHSISRMEQELARFAHGAAAAFSRAASICHRRRLHRPAWHRPQSRRFLRHSQY
jgi:glycine cleavage system transcriptional repressor